MNSPTEAGPTMPVPSGPLDYAHKPPRLTRRRVRGVILMTIGAALLVAGLYGWGPIQARITAWNRQWRLDRLQAACMAYVAPAGHVAYEEEPAQARQLVKQAGYRAVEARMVAQTNWVGPTTHPVATPPPVVHVPPTWAKFATFNDDRDEISRKAPGLVFMHERLTPSGQRMLVCVAAAMEAFSPPALDWEGWQKPLPWGMRRSLYAWAITPGSARTPGAWQEVGTFAIEGSGARDAVTFFSNDPANPIAPPFPLRLYAGKIDPQDASRFTIDYELIGIGHRGTITGAIRDDGSIWFTADAGEVVPRTYAHNPERTWKVPTTRPTAR